MLPNNGSSDTKLPMELNLSESSIVNEESTQQRTKCCSVNSPQDTPMLQHDYEAVLDMIGFGRTQWIMLLVCGMLLMVLINETMGMSIITIASQCDFATSSVDKAVMNAASFVGIGLCSYVWGYLSDTTGRRTVLLYSTVGATLFSTISMFIPNYWVYVFMRFVVGLFIAGPSSTTYAYLGEFYTTRHCAVVLNYASLFVGIGMVYVPAIAWLVLTMDWSLHISENFTFRPWRVLTPFYLLPGLIATVVLTALPESPKLLLSLGKDEEALTAVNWICRRNTGKDLKQLGVEKLRAEETMEVDKKFLRSKSCYDTIKHIWLETRPLLRRPYVLNFMICCTCMSGMFFSSTGMALWFSEIQNRVSSNADGRTLTICELITQSNGDSVNNSTKPCTDHISNKSYLDSIYLGLCFIAGYALVGVIINIFGRKATIIGSMFLSAACCLALNWLTDPIAIVIFFIVFVTMPGVCVSLLGSGVVNLVPTYLRGKAVCICFLIGRAGSVFGSNIIGAMLESYCNLTFSLFSGIIFVSMLLILILPI
ncbi:synaptic vesicle glycoprotein 2B [Anastrepha obliqua]|uniref:synaptic vesicle glycoprotein 2B n=1 Tax=Anastrepha obliqua TaxID=95512 RepID=UPI00240A8F84|nr:synaptic vesicle glycoprotein 2B [Anastrepha obliqua]